MCYDPLHQIEVFIINMDKFRIKYICSKRPDIKLKLYGFEAGGKYTGRTFNGLFEISPQWGSDLPTRLVNQKTFFEYFKVTD